MRGWDAAARRYDVVVDDAPYEGVDVAVRLPNLTVVGTAASAARAGAGAEGAAEGEEEADDDDDEPPEPSAEALRDLDERSPGAVSSADLRPPAAAPPPTAGTPPAAAAASVPTEEPAAATAGAEGVVDVGDDDVIVLKAAPSEIERDAELKAALTELQRLVGHSQAEGAASSGAIDRSDVGTAKRRKLTAQQKKWAAGERGGGYSDLHDDDLDSDDDDDVCTAWVLGLYRGARHLYAPHRDAVVPGPPPADCDCGQPWKRVGGRHVCRYFGYFSCACGKRWTSAYTWKGERQVCVHVYMHRLRPMWRILRPGTVVPGVVYTVYGHTSFAQACRACNKESDPTKTEKLDGRISMGNGRPHDCARCSMCAQLGRDCSV